VPDHEPVRLEREGTITHLRIGRRGEAVRLSARIHTGLCGAVDEIDHDEDVRVVVVASSGRSFCSGDDRDSPPPGTAADGVAALARVRVPVIALLHGEVLDAGFELALACDLRVAAASARLGLTQLSRGELPVRGGTQRLPRIVGRSHALRMLLLGDRVRAREALALGIVHEVVPGAALASAGKRLARRISRRAPLAQRLAKEALGAALDMPLAEGLRLEGDLYVLLQTTRDREEGIASFRERRVPVFVGR
jgi:enoyl-CoA hydratase